MFDWLKTFGSNFVYKQADKSIEKTVTYLIFLSALRIKNMLHYFYVFISPKTRLYSNSAKLFHDYVIHLN